MSNYLPPEPGDGCYVRLGGERLYMQMTTPTGCESWAPVRTNGEWQTWEELLTEGATIGGVEVVEITPVTRYRSYCAACSYENLKGEQR